MNEKKILKKILSGSKNIAFDDFVKLIFSFGFFLDRENGSHHIFKRKGIIEMLNIQNVNGQVKPYQVKQFLTIIENYGLKMEETK
ncbi:MAG: type II toxin-antitoxin system HicA family toxin [Candidatus Kapabacteria bacterium]|nr:type II toxin-antitoxin system HicA family toxin [Ignavibacteriota bacterium]MCW5884979.1 type II toxin-antitoxin system HicA family toxin [Candidatus Kapabacteria bacterium]